MYRKIRNAKYMSKFDLIKGYWQVPLTERAKDVSGFVTPDGHYIIVLAFGMKKGSASFQRLMNGVTTGLEDCGCYIDDLINYSYGWSSHMKQL